MTTILKRHYRNNTETSQIPTRMTKESKDEGATCPTGHTTVITKLQQEIRQKFSVPERLIELRFYISLDTK